MLSVVTGGTIASSSTTIALERSDTMLSEDVLSALDVSARVETLLFFYLF